MGAIARLFSRIRQALYIIPKEHKEEIKKELIDTNFTRIYVSSVILLLLDACLLIVDIGIYRQRWSVNLGYLNLFYGHIVLAIERSIYRECEIISVNSFL